MTPLKYKFLLLIIIYNSVTACTFIRFKRHTGLFFPKNNILITRGKLSKCAFKQSTDTYILNKTSSIVCCVASLLQLLNTLELVLNSQ